MLKPIIISVFLLFNGCEKESQNSKSRGITTEPASGKMEPMQLTSEELEVHKRFLTGLASRQDILETKFRPMDIRILTAEELMMMATALSKSGKSDEAYALIEYYSVRESRIHYVKMLHAYGIRL
jgi:hypothetical protein